MKTFVYKLRPSSAQAALFAETLETCRRLYNHALDERKTAYTKRGETLAFTRQCATLPQLKQTWHWLKRVHSQVLQDVLHRLQHAFDGFFRRLKAGDTPGYPRFRGKGWYDSFTYRQWGNGAAIERGRLILSKIGAVRIVRDRPLQGTPKPARLCGKPMAGMPTSRVRYLLSPCRQPVSPWAWMLGWRVSLRSRTGRVFRTPSCIAPLSASLSERSGGCRVG